MKKKTKKLLTVRVGLFFLREKAPTKNGRRNGHQTRNYYKEETRTNRNASKTTNPRSETIETQTSGSKTDRSIGVQASNTENSDSEVEDYPLRPSVMKNLRHPAKLLCRSELDLDSTVVSIEDSEEEDYRSAQ